VLPSREETPQRLERGRNSWSTEGTTIAARRSECIGRSEERLSKGIAKVLQERDKLCTLKKAKKAHLGKTWPAVQKNQEWIRDVLAADHHPLIDAVRTEILYFSDSTWKGFAVGSKKRRCLSQRPLKDSKHA